MASGGFINLYRKLLEWRFAQHPIAVALWIRLLLRANWQDGYFHGREIPRGSLAASAKTLAEETGISENTVRRWLKKFEENGEITTESTNKFTIITIPKYNEYQNATWSDVSTQVGNQVSNQLSDQVGTQMSEQMSTQVGNQVSDDIKNKEIKKERNKEEKREDVADAPPSRSPSLPTLMDVKIECQARGYICDPNVYFQYRTAHGWKADAARNWKQDLAIWNAREQTKAPVKPTAEAPKSEPKPAKARGDDELPSIPDDELSEEEREQRRSLLEQLKGQNL
jgi:hypothetical protein